MTLRTKFLITSLFLCHELPATALVTRQLLAEDSDRAAVQAGAQQAAPAEKTPSQPPIAPCASQAATQDADATTICALQQEKDGPIYKLHGNAEIHYRGYVLRADEVIYNSDSGEATASGHLTLDGGAKLHALGHRPRRQGRGRGLHMATANLATNGTIHAD